MRRDTTGRQTALEEALKDVHDCHCGTAQSILQVAFGEDAV